MPERTDLSGARSRPDIECGACRSTAHAAIYRSPRGMVYRCCDCGIFFVDDAGAEILAQEKLFYSTIDEGRYRVYFERFRSVQYRQVLSRLNLGSGKTLLDIGASYGWMVRAALDLGLDAYGVEPGDAGCDRDLRERIFRSSLQQYCAIAHREFDIVTIWHVLEHLRDPVGVLSQMKSLLAKDGVLVVAVPTTDGWMFRLALVLKAIGSHKLLYELFYLHNPNMHFFYHNLRSLSTLLERNGFEIMWSDVMEAFDWTTIWKRAPSPLVSLALRLLGPFIKLSRFTARENLIIVSRRKEQM